MTAPYVSPSMTAVKKRYDLGPLDPNALPTQQSFGPDQNLIGTQFNAPPSWSLTQPNQQVSDWQSRVSGFGGLTPWNPQAAQDTSGSQQLYNQAQRDIGQAQAGTYGPVQGSNLGPAYGYLTQAGQRAQDTSLGPFQTVGPTDLSQAQGTLGQVQGQIGRAQLGPLQGYGRDVGQARAATLNALGSLTQAPSRSQTAQNLYDALAQQETANTGRAIQQLGQRAASLGQLGQGQVTAQAGDIFGQREANLAAIRANLAAETAGQEQGDLLNRLQAAQGVTQGLGGLDLSQAGLGLQAGQAEANLALQRAGALQGLAGQQAGFATQQRGESAAERDARLALRAQQAGLNLSSAGQLAGLGGQTAQLAQIPTQEALAERAFQAQQGNLGAQLALQRAGARQGLGAQQFGQGQALEQLGLQRAGARQQAELANLGAQQGVLSQLLGAQQQQYGQNLGNLGFQQQERGYQQGLDQQALENRIRQQQLQDQLLNSDFGRQMEQLGLLGQYGFQGPSPTGLGLADYYGQQSGDTNAAMAQLLNSLGQGTGQPAQADVVKKWDPSSQRYVTPYVGQ